MAVDMSGFAKSRLERPAQDWASTVGVQMQELGRQVLRQAPHSGWLGAASQTLASGLDAGGTYLEHATLNSLQDDAAELIRRNPVPALCVGLGAGFLLARILKR